MHAPCREVDLDTIIINPSKPENSRAEQQESKQVSGDPELRPGSTGDSLPQPRCQRQAISCTRIPGIMRLSPLQNLPTRTCRKGFILMVIVVYPFISRHLRTITEVRALTLQFNP